jgi:two-component system, sensor histidine kinase and response regulator
MAKTEKPYVLIVDDNEATLTLLTALLQRDFSLDFAMDGHEAIEKLRTKHYAASLLDLRMPQVDGFAVLDDLNSDKPEMLSRVIVVTAALTKSELARVAGFGVYGVIAKPFEVDALLAAVKECAERVEGNQLGRFLSSGVMLLIADIIRHKLM